MTSAATKRPHKNLPTKPITLATRPMAMVSQGGIGSGPGSAKRASAPVMNAMNSVEITDPRSTPRSVARGTSAPN